MDRQEIIIYKTKDGKVSVALYAQDGDVWLNQNQLAGLFATSKPNISQHISNILKEKQLRCLVLLRAFWAIHQFNFVEQKTGCVGARHDLLSYFEKSLKPCFVEG